jgi:hypothetical protein
VRCGPDGPDVPSWFLGKKDIGPNNITCECILTRLLHRQVGTNPTFSTVWNAFKCYNDEQLKSYVHSQGKDKVWTCTVGQGDILFTPPCCVVAERSSAPFGLGVKANILSRAHKQEYAKVYNELQAKGKLQGSGELVQLVYTELNLGRSPHNYVTAGTR